MSIRKPRTFKLLIKVWGTPDDAGWCDRGFLYDENNERVWFGPMSTSPDQCEYFNGSNWRNFYPWIAPGKYIAEFEESDIPSLAFKGITPSRTPYTRFRSWADGTEQNFVCSIIPGSEGSRRSRGSDGHITVAPSHVIAFFSFFGKGDVVFVTVNDAVTLKY
jgi:hypothetical protein